MKTTNEAKLEELNIKLKHLEEIRNNHKATKNFKFDSRFCIQTNNFSNLSDEQLFYIEKVKLISKQIQNIHYSIRKYEYRNSIMLDDIIDVHKLKVLKANIVVTIDSLIKNKNIKSTLKYKEQYDSAFVNLYNAFRFFKSTQIKLIDNNNNE